MRPFSHTDDSQSNRQVKEPDKAPVLLPDAAERRALDTAAGIALASYGTAIRPSGELLLRS